MLWMFLFYKCKKYGFVVLGSLYVEHWEKYGIRQKYSFVAMCQCSVYVTYSLFNIAMSSEVTYHREKVNITVNI